MPDSVTARYPDPAFVSRFLAGLPPDLAASFTERQLWAIQQAFGPWDGRERRRGRHLTLSLPWKRYRLSLAGLDAPDHRGAAERAAMVRGALAALAGVGLLAACGLLLLVI